MKTATKAILGVVVLAAFAGGGLAMKNRKPAGPASQAAAIKAAPSLEISSADLVKVESRDLARTLPFTGALNPQVWSYVKAKVAGEVREMAPREGDTVQAGQIIARLDTLELDAKVAQAQGALDSSRATFELTKKTLENNRNLLAKNFISQITFDNSQSSFSAAEGNLKAAQAAVVLAKKALDDAVVRAPHAGVVATRNAQPGEKVAIDARLYQIMDLSRMEVEASVPAAEIASVVVGQEVSFRVEGHGERAFKGAIARIAPATQAGSRSILAYAVLPNADGVLRGGMFAKGALKLGNTSGALAVPQAAVREDGQGKFVYTVEGNKLARASVELGMQAEDEGLVQVLKGLPVGATVIKTNLGELQPGATVVIAGTKAAAK